MLKPSFSWSLLDTLAYSTAWVARTAARSLLASSDDRVLAGIAFPHYRVWGRSVLVGLPGSWDSPPTGAHGQRHLYAASSMSFIRLSPRPAVLDSRTQSRRTAANSSSLALVRCHSSSLRSWPTAAAIVMRAACSLFG